MTERQILLVKHSWSYFTNRLEEVGEIFYRVLFEMDTEIRPMFSEKMNEQAYQFASTINLIVSQLQSLENIDDRLRDLGKAHESSGIEKKHYDMVIISLLVTLEHLLGDKWNNEMREAWTNAFQVVSKRMKELDMTARQPFFIL